MTLAEYKELIEWACAMVGATVIVVRVVWVLSRLLEPNINSNAKRERSDAESDVVSSAL